MSSALTIAFMLIPLILLVFAYVWAFHLRSRPTLLRRTPLALLYGGTALLFAGDTINGFWAADGFHAGYFAFGVLIVAGIYGIVFWMRRRGSAGARLQAALETVREDFREPVSTGPRRKAWLAILAFLPFAALFYVITITSFHLNPQFTYFAQEFLDEIRALAERTSLLDYILRRECDTNVLYNPSTFVIFAFIDRLDVITVHHVRLLMVAAIFGINLWFHRKRSAALLLLSHLFFLLVTLDPAHEFNNSAYTETFFAVVFFVNLLMVLDIRFTIPWFLATGFVTGIGFISKELNVLNLALLAFVLATAGLSRRRFLALATAAIAAFTIPTAFFMVSFLECGVTEGLYHIPIAWFRGAEIAGMTQSNVYLLADQGMAFPMAELILRRLSFQTVGEVFAGGLRQVGLFTLVGVFPVAWMVANFPRRKMRVIGFLLFLAFPLYGITFWKGGDSSDPLYTLLPFGYVFAGPFLVRLATRFAGIVKQRRFLERRSLYIHALVIVNLLFVGSYLKPAWQVARDTRFIKGFGSGGLAFAHRPNEQERSLSTTLRGLQRDGQIGDWLFVTDCHDSDMPKILSVMEPGIFMNIIDIRYDLLPAIVYADHQRLQDAFDVMIREFDYSLEGVESLYVLACRETQPPSEQMGSTLLDPGSSLLDGCAHVVQASPGREGWILFAFPKESCRQYIRPELDRARGVRQERTPLIPLFQDAAD